ncbi:MAG: hypothetical protein A2X12_05135 [Bacteroidetes bacterium GWE2_29_8]|nr:MAG: hypothetical protein A2X12_05135 [Bacteroidetes bacterium GWE2_29_8]OFY21705.1 MAG: hypothetical protein A2X02_04610 [Bacteroidetes bacterium GWF2_29_10]
MKRRSQYLIWGIFICFIISSSCKQQINVVNVNKIPNEEINRQGLYYALPKTALTIDVTIKKTENNVGIYYQYAEKLLGIKDYVKKNNTYWEIVSFDINEFIVPDENHYYYVELPRKRDEKTENNTIAELNENGMIVSLNSKSNILGEIKEADLQNKQINKDLDNSLLIPINSNLTEKVDTIIRTEIIDSIPVQNIILSRSIVEKSLEDKAKETTEFIFKLQDKKFNLIWGEQEVNYEKNTLEFMFKELERKQNEYISLFKGNTSTQYYKYKFVYIPKVGDDANNPILLRFSQSEGLVNSSKDGKAILLNMQKISDNRKLSGFISEISKHNEEGKKGYYYRIPELFKVWTEYGENVKFEKVITIPQLGVTNFLPAYKYNVNFNPKTGAIKSIGK